ncbi:protein MENT [Microcebus murinus]|uniref:Chromosome 1 open reading frame 56 n=1 Tax=Microcebus murinus TaxID=30608 RepID=A0A8B7GJV0_MICMU|nr:protein MENT [Microcebus murinus]
MVGVLLWALLLSLGSWAAGAEDQTQTLTGTPHISFSFGGPPIRHRSTARPRLPRRTKIILEDEDDATANADRLAGPAAAELLASTVSTSDSRSSMFEDGSLEEGVVINARKNKFSPETPGATRNTAGGSTTFIANSQEPEIRLITGLPRSTRKSTEDQLASAASLTRWSTPGSTPSRWPSLSRTAMPPPEDLHLVLMPWGPWHCHCKSGTMSRTRSGKLQGLSGRLRVGALSQLRTEHRPCTYQQCACNRLQEECPLDTGFCSGSNCASPTTTTSTTFPSIQARRRPLLPPPTPTPNPALAFWKRVRIGLEDIWNSLSTVFTEMQPIDRNRR